MWASGYTIPSAKSGLAPTNHNQPFRLRHPPQTTLAFETESGEQAEVDWGQFSHLTPESRWRSVRASIMVLGWCRAIYPELVRRA